MEDYQQLIMIHLNNFHFFWLHHYKSMIEESSS